MPARDEQKQSLDTRPPAVAGLFYPGEARNLDGAVDTLLSAVRVPPDETQSVPKALIVPHAGYVYSGPIAASAYRLLAPARETIRRVVLLGPTHRVAVRGLALPAAARFATPLGTVDLDAEAAESIRRLRQVVVSDEPHALEHSLEVHLPFLQKVLASFRLVPLAVGYASAEDVAQVLEALWGGPETLIVVSSDLSHYLSYAHAQRVDRVTCEAILQLDTAIDHEQACGATPLSGLTLLAQRKALRPRLLDLRNSGDTAGDRSRVVGYASFAFYEP
jgi:AmmeMemoRadiSam system protein B